MSEYLHDGVDDAQSDHEPFLIHVPYHSVQNGDHALPVVQQEFGTPHQNVALDDAHRHLGGQVAEGEKGCGVNGTALDRECEDLRTDMFACTFMIHKQILTSR